MNDDRTGENRPEQGGYYPQQESGGQPGAQPSHGAFQHDPYQQHAQYQQPYRPGYGPGYQPTEQFPTAAPAAVQRKPRGKTAIVAGALALALVSGGVGGAVGAYVADTSQSGTTVTNSLNAPRSNAAPAVNAPDGSVQAVAQKVLPSVVMIKIAGSQGEGEGSGVILSSDGLILTNNHVATGGGAGTKLEVAFSDGSTAPATLVGADSVSDLAVIKVSGRTDLTPIELGSSDGLQVGQQVIAVGSPLGLAGTVTTGIVSSLNRPVSTSGEILEPGHRDRRDPDRRRDQPGQLRRCVGGHERQADRHQHRDRDPGRRERDSRRAGRSASASRSRSIRPRGWRTNSSIPARRHTR